jgi:hypothetical protein
VVIMLNLPNLDRLERRARFNRIDVTTREIQVLNIRHDYERTPIDASNEKAHRMADAVPSLLAHIDELHGRVHAVLAELDKARFEVTQIAIDTSPAYAQLRDERDSARRERDEAMRKQEPLRVSVVAALAVLDSFDTLPADDLQVEALIDRARNLLRGAR